MIEHLSDQGLLLLKCLEMRRLAGSLNVARARVVAVDALARNQPLERPDRLDRGVEELARARFAESGDERCRIQLQPGEHLTCIARACAPARSLLFDHHDRRPTTSNLECGGQSRIARADNRDIDATPFERFWVLGSGFWVRFLVLGSGFRGCRAQRIPPVRILFQPMPRFIGL